MRLVLAFIPLLLTASAALADPPAQRTPTDTTAPAAARHHRLAPTHQLTQATYPAYHHDAASDGNCYFIFGDLHCDRIARTPHK